MSAPASGGKFAKALVSGAPLRARLGLGDMTTGEPRDPLLLQAFSIIDETPDVERIAPRRATDKLQLFSLEQPHLHQAARKSVVPLNGQHTCLGARRKLVERHGRAVADIVANCN